MERVARVSVLRRFPAVLLGASAVFLSAGRPDWVKLNDPLVAPAYTTITGFALTSDGSLVLYRADLDVDERFELYASSMDGSGATRRVSAPMSNPDGDVTTFTLAPGGTHVVYNANADQSFELFSARIDGSVAPVRLNDPGAHVLAYRTSDDGLQVAYVSEQAPLGPRELFRVPIDGQSQPTKLSGSIVDGGDVLTEDFALTSDGSRAVYIADQEIDQVFELFSSDGVLPPVKLNAALVSGGDVDGGRPRLLIAPDDEQVVYVADQEVDERRQLYSVPIDGSQPPVRLDSASPGESAAAFQISPDARWVAFDLYQSLFTAPIDGSVAATHIASHLSDRFYGRQYAIDHASERLVYRAWGSGVDQLWSAPVDGAGESILLNPPLSECRVYDFCLVPLLDRVAFRFLLSADSPDLLASVPIDGHAPAVLLNAPGPEATVGDFAESGGRILYLSDQETWHDFALYSTPADGAAASVRVSGPMVAGGDATAFVTNADGSSTVYRADQERDSVFELFAAPADGSTASRRVTPALPSGPIAGDVGFYQVSPDASRVVYIADQEVDGLFEAYSVPIDASSTSVKLNEGRVCSIAITPDGSRAVHALVGEELQVFAGPVDGSAPATWLATLPYPPGEFRTVELLVSPDSQRVLCSVVSFSYPNLVHEPLFSAPVDGAQPAIQLCQLGASGFEIDASSTRAVFPQAAQLVSRPLDGSAAVVTLNGPLVPGGSVSAFDITPDGQRVVYAADQRVDGRRELFSVPIDGSAAALVLSGPAAGEGVGNFAVSSDARWAVFAMETALGTGLFSRPVDRSGPLVVLAPVEGVWNGLRLSALGRAVYSDAGRLWSAPVDGSSAAIALANTTSSDVMLSPDGTRAVYKVSLELFSVPIEGSAAPIPLEVPDMVLRYAITSDSSAVVAEGSGLFQVPIDGGMRPVRLNGPLTEGGDVSGFLIASDSRTVVYKADQETDEVNELFATRLQRWIVTMPPPSRSDIVRQD